ncbi:acetyltransferase [Rhodobacterales bacterium HTCC2150]|nr:acetyltransferase [Rhodobacterales bacterium HTCC2150] [Rhodobacteraceae bacterium HTCC2150]
MPKFKISTPTHTHVPALLEQIHALAQHHNDVPRISQHKLAGLIAQDEINPHILVACSQKDPAQVFGYCAIVPLIRLQFCEKLMDIHHLFVSPEQRGFGIGHELITSAFDHAINNRAQHLTVGTTEENLKAQAFYLSQGFMRMDNNQTRFSKPVLA